MLSAPLLLMALLTVNVPSPDIRPCEWDRHRIELPPEPSQEVHEVCISAGLATTLLFDSPLQPEAVELEEAGGFNIVEASGRLLTLVPSNRLVRGRRLRLSVRFADRGAPESATFILVVHPDRAEGQVEVFRSRQVLEVCQRELSELQTEFAQLRARCNQESDLAGRAVSLMIEEGREFTVRDISENVTWATQSRLRRGLRLIRYHSTRPKDPAHTRVVLQVELTFLSTGPLRLIKTGNFARRTHSMGLKTWQIPSPSNEMRILLEVYADIRDLQHHQHSLSLLYEKSSATEIITIRGITFTEPAD